MNARVQKPGIRQRLAAMAAIALVTLVLALGVMSMADDLRRFLIQAPLLLAALCAAWYALTRVGVRRLSAVVVCIASLAGVVSVAFVEEGEATFLALLRLVLLLLAVALGGFALTHDVRSLRATTTPGAPVPAATGGVLIMNPKSGGGKAERFHLAD